VRVKRVNAAETTAMSTTNRKTAMSTTNRKSIRLTESTLKKLIVQEVRRFLKEDDKNKELKQACLEAVKKAEAEWKPEIDKAMRAVLTTEAGDFRHLRGVVSAFKDVIFDRYWAMLYACRDAKDSLLGLESRSFSVEGLPRSVLDYIMSRADGDYSIAEEYTMLLKNLDDGELPDSSQIRDIIQNSKNIKSPYEKLSTGDKDWYHLY